MPSGWIISSGDELTEGRLADTNGAWLAKHLSDRGATIDRILLIGDDLPLLVRLLREAATTIDFVAITGGLGSTADDVTRDAISAAFDRPFEFRPEADRAIQSFWEERKRTPPPRPWPEASAPRGCILIDNTFGIAPGLRLDVGRCSIFAFPGVPFELESMVNGGAFDVLFETDTPNRRADIGIIGPTESELARRLDHMLDRGRNPLIGICAKDGYLMLHVRGTATDADEAQRLVDADVQRIRSNEGNAVFTISGETLAESLVRHLIERNSTLAVAESLTGGMIGHLLTEVPGVSAALLADFVCYANEAKVATLGVRKETLAAHGAVSRECAIEMVLGALDRSGADIAVATTGIAGPSGGSGAKPVGTTWLAVARRGEGVHAEMRNFGRNRSGVKKRATHSAMNLVRRVLIGDLTLTPR